MFHIPLRRAREVLLRSVHLLRVGGERMREGGRRERNKPGDIRAEPGGGGGGGGEEGTNWITEWTNGT